MSNEPFKVTPAAIIPQAKLNETQIILQRHCNYDKEKGGLIPESVNIQKEVVNKFNEIMNSQSSNEELRNTYFLFVSSGTISTSNFKRAKETTNIAMNEVKKFFENNSISSNNILNLDLDANYNREVREDKHLTEPSMFTDSSGYLEYLKEKHGGINKDFWIDFEGDLSIEKRKKFNTEGPEEIVNRAVRYLNVLKRYSDYFHKKNPNSRLIIWNGTHYDILSPLVKQRILNYDKEDIVKVDNCGGLSVLIDEFNTITINMNGITYPFDLQYDPQLYLHYRK